MSTEPAPTDRRPAAAGHVLVTGLVALVLAAFLNAPALMDTARRLEIGLERTIAVSVMRPVAATSSALRLDRARTAIDELLGRRDTEPATLPLTFSVEAAARDVDTKLPTPSSSDPGLVWIIGDSLVELLGPHLTDIVDDNTDLVETDFTFRYISGLSRPDFFDWPEHIAERVANDPPDVIVAMFGGNDGQSVTFDGTVYDVWTRPWWRLYTARVAEAMDAMRSDHLRAYWIGLPVMKDPDFSERAQQMSTVYRDEAEERPWMRYVDILDLFADASGAYSDYLPNPNGDLRLMRYEDGVHLTPSGARRLARHIYEILEQDWGL